MLTSGKTNKMGQRLMMLSLLAPALLLPAQQASRPVYTGAYQAQQGNTQRPAYQPGNTSPANGVNRGGNQQFKPNNEGQRGPGQRPQDQLRPNGPPGHLADWLSQHRDLPPQQQEQLLRRDPYFNRLNPNEQRKVINQLYRMNEMSDKQRERRMARAEAIERLTPQKMQVNASAQRMQLLPEPRRQLLIKAFRDLRAVPFEQRDAVLGSAYYRSTFSPDERLILHDLLKVEPLEPLR